MTNNKKFRLYTIWLLVAVFFAYQSILRVLPNIMIAEITEQFKIDASQLGQFSGIYYIGYALFHIPIGIMLDRFNLKHVLSVCILLTAAGLAPLLYSDHWFYLTFGRFITGIGSSAAILGCFKTIRIAFPAEKFTSMLGVSVTIGLIGAIYGGQPVYALMQQFGWQQVVFVLMVIGFVMAGAVLIIGHYKDSNTENEQNSIYDDVLAFIRNPKIMILCLMGGLMISPIEGFADAWGAEFLKSVYSIESGLATQLGSYIFVGACFGASILSFITEKTKAYYGIIILSALFMLLGFVYILLGSASVTGIMIIFTIIGVLCAYQIPLLYKISTFVPDRLAGMSAGFTNMIVMIFGYFFHSLIGQSIMWHWDGTMVANQPLYAPIDYQYGLSIIPVCMFIAIIGTAYVRYRDNKEISAST